MKRILILLVVATLVMTNAFAQKGYLRGKVIDTEIGEGLIGGNVYVEGTTNGTVTDFNGDYSLPLEAGTYTIVFSSISYRTVTVSEVEIKTGEVTKLDINMEPDVQQLEGVVVTAEVLKNSDEALLTVQKKSVRVLDGMSSNF